jgi:hypothetical protein
MIVHGTAKLGSALFEALDLRGQVDAPLLRELLEFADLVLEMENGLLEIELISRLARSGHGASDQA